MAVVGVVNLYSWQFTLNTATKKVAKRKQKAHPLVNFSYLTYL